MKRKIFNSKHEFNKKKYVVLIILVVIGIVTGIIFANIINYSNKEITISKMTNYFINIKDGSEINYIGSFMNNLGINYAYMLLIWIFGLSIIGILLNPLILYFKSFVIGFSLSSIISIYSYKGILGGILYIFPHQIINLIVYILLTYYSVNFSIKLFQTLFMKKQNKFNLIIKKYLQILLIASITLLISTAYETFLLPFVLKFFTILIN